MSELPELSSKRKIQSVPLESERNPNGVPNGTRDGYGMGRGSGSKSSWQRRATERKPMREIYAKELAWAAEYLPEEHGPFVCLAIESVKRQGLKPSTQTVFAQLRATHRDSVSCRERAERYG